MFQCLFKTSRNWGGGIHMFYCSFVILNCHDWWGPAQLVTVFGLKLVLSAHFQTWNTIASNQTVLIIIVQTSQLPQNMSFTPKAVLSPAETLLLQEIVCYRSAMAHNQPYNFHDQVKTEINYFFCSVLLSFKHTMDLCTMKLLCCIYNYCKNQINSNWNSIGHVDEYPTMHFWKSQTNSANDSIHV